jgi:hypothetical protein
LTKEGDGIMKITKLLILIIMFVSTAIVSAQQHDLSKQRVLYSVGYAHLDTQWRWDYPTTIDKYIWNTMEDNFRLFQKYPDYVFNFTGANRYMFMKEYWVPSSNS